MIVALQDTKYKTILSDKSKTRMEIYYNAYNQMKQDGLTDEEALRIYTEITRIGVQRWFLDGLPDKIYVWLCLDYFRGQATMHFPPDFKPTKANAKILYQAFPKDICRFPVFIDAFNGMVIKWATLIGLPPDFKFHFIKDNKTKFMFLNYVLFSATKKFHLTCNEIAVYTLLWAKATKTGTVRVSNAYILELIPIKQRTLTGIFKRLFDLKLVERVYRATSPGTASLYRLLDPPNWNENHTEFDKTSGKKPTN